MRNVSFGGMEGRGKDGVGEGLWETEGDVKDVET